MAKKKTARKRTARAKARPSARKDLPARGKARKVKGGVTAVPRVGWEVNVSFSPGDTRAPVVTGNLWNSKDRPPA